MLRRCLEREVKDRLRDAGDARLDHRGGDGLGPRGQSSAAFARRTPRGRMPAAWAVAILLTALGGLAGRGNRCARAPTVPVRRLGAELALADA